MIKKKTAPTTSTPTHEAPCPSLVATLSKASKHPLAAADGLVRCSWCGSDALYQKYHDEEWGKERRDELGMFEFMVLESAQSGLSWITILRKREGYRAAFDGFDPEKIAQYGPADVERLMNDGAIVRNQKKIEATIHNARLVCALHREGHSLSEIAWSSVGGKRKINARSHEEKLPASTDESTAFSECLKTMGFKHFGPVVAYSFMQALGLVDDHTMDCHQYSGPNPGARKRA